MTTTTSAKGKLSKKHDATFAKTKKDGGANLQVLEAERFQIPEKIFGFAKNMRTKAGETI